MDFSELKSLLDQRNPGKYKSARWDNVGNKRIIRASTGSRREGEESIGDEITDSWAKVFDLQYERMLGTDESTFVWRSSYDGGAIPAHEMFEWLQQAIDNIKEFHPEPQSIIEIGCGNGLIHTKLIDAAKHYVGIDTAEASLSSLSQTDEYKNNPAKTEVFKAEASAIGDLPVAAGNLVILNSVVQYFPSLDYLLEVISGLENKLLRNSTVYIGDIRSLHLQPLFCFDVAYRKTSPDKWSPMAEKLERREKELLLDPEVFQRLPKLFNWIDNCHIRIKKGNSENEMTRYRYEAVLKCHSDHPLKPAAATFLNWKKDALSLQDAQHRLSQVKSGNGLVITGVPNSRFQQVMKSYREANMTTKENTEDGFSSLPVSSLLDLATEFPDLQIDIDNDPDHLGRLRFMAYAKGDRIDINPPGKVLDELASRVSVNPFEPVRALNASGDLPPALTDADFQQVSDLMMQLAGSSGEPQPPEQVR